MFGSKKKSKSQDAPSLDLVLNRLNLSADVEDTSKPQIPRAKRLPSFAEVTVINEAGYKRTGVVLDISTSGARLRFRSKESISQQVRLKVPKFRIDCFATVIWKRDNEVGVQFYETQSMNPVIRVTQANTSDEYRR